MIVELGTADFPVFFRAIHGCNPFPWQRELVDHLAEHDDWPRSGVLNLPTGSGKTAALDAAVFHLALRFECPARAALRIALVVDRRLVVDDAHARAEKIANLLANPANAAEHGRSVVVEVARRLQCLAGDGEPPLIARRLRGGAPLEHDWARTPTQPTILCSTVDQVGSRLLFRGYGVSNRMQPVHAGLLGTHCLILLDEAHLSEPFRQTVQAVREIGQAKVRMVLLSATPGASSTGSFELTKNDHVHPVLKPRLEASKPATLVVESRDPVDSFARSARKIAGQLRKAGVLAPAVGVVVNRVDLARNIFMKLQEAKRDTGADAVLMIGRSRDIGRDRIDAALAPFRTGAPRPSRTAATDSADERQIPLFPETSEESDAGPLFVVATQCLEVGVDLDLDGLVTQAAPLDSLRQRFGRVNRAGRAMRAAGTVLALADDIKKKADDPVYGDRIVRTWEVLQRLARGGTVDFGIKAFDLRLRELAVDVPALASPRTSAPVLMPAYLDLWSRTCPPPAADPDVSLFLHGVEHASASVSFVWRGDITEADLKPNAAADLPTVDLPTLLRLVPARAAEMVEVPLWAAKAWLRRPRDSESAAQIADVPQRSGDQETGRTRWGGRRAFRWAGVDDPNTGLVQADELRPGDVLIVPAEYGGCDEFGWAPNFHDRVTDVADDAARPFRGRRHAVRIACDVVANKKNQWARIVEVLADEGLDGGDLVERLLDVLPAEPAPDPENENGDEVRPRQVRKALEALQHAKKKGRIDKHFPYAGGPKGGAVLVAPHGLRQKGAAEDGMPATEDDRLSQTSRNAVSIDVHTAHVVERVENFVRTLKPSAASDLELAAFLHDAGKADQRFQEFLSGGDPWNSPDGDAMAKSGQSLPPGAWKRAGLPTGWRHEALSVRLAQVHPRFVKARDRDLVLWLIGTHHGFGRPFFDFVDSRYAAADQDGCVGCLEVEHWRAASGPGPQSLAFDLAGADWAALYEQLKQEYGIWGLAHLEAVLRLADHRASEFEQRHD